MPSLSVQASAKNDKQCKSQILTSAYRKVYELVVKQLQPQLFEKQELIWLNGVFWVEPNRVFW